MEGLVAPSVSRALALSQRFGNKRRLTSPRITYTKKCFICDYRPACAGIYIEYLLNFGDSEIKPVKIGR
ncbi:MAG: hypothetical protein QME40_01010 [bacterium]|nr:hypothetical protein [bacterium]